MQAQETEDNVNQQGSLLDNDLERATANSLSNRLEKTNECKDESQSKTGPKPSTKTNGNMFDSF